LTLKGANGVAAKPSWKRSIG